MQAPRPKLDPTINVLHTITNGFVEALDTSDSSIYCYAMPTIYPFDNLYVLDCWVVDREGNADPGLNGSPVPIRVENLKLVEETAGDDRDVVRGYSS